MKFNYLYFGVILLSIVCITPHQVMGQYNAKKRKKKNTYNPRKPKDDPFSKSQWWLGFRAGANLTEATPDERFSAFSPINYQEEENEKKYGSFEKLGGHAGIEITYFHQRFSFSFQPNYRRQRFIYSNEFLWEDPNDANNRVELKYEQDHQLDYIEFPLFIKYDLTQTRLRPFLQLGGYYAILTSANKSVEVSGADFASGGNGPFENEKLIIGAEDLFLKSSLGVSGGLGFTYDVYNSRIVFDITYRYGLNNITNAENRFSENQLSGIGDALDDIKLQNVAASLGILFPLRYITKNSKSFDAVN
ncbi:PorT family protein [Fulvivirga sp. M361]|uniref:outer membrane beta-barrel protein n=1 Tax=Fulvivirga sp. M361 TaxID=2594266 RepID=UPI00117B1A2A|nr:outer membrane beta-barrel protein [Fulvivirga sp. M361]TRX47315.1 PorT family protein [Fulvivirga sp. M361]